MAPKSIEIDKEKLHVKFLAFNVDFNGPSLSFLRLMKLVHEGIKEQYLYKSHYFTAVGKYFVIMVADRHGNAACSDELIGCNNINDFEGL